MSAYVVVCGHCPKGHVIVETYADAEQQGWHWTERQGWRCPSCIRVPATAGKARR